MSGPRSIEITGRRALRQRGGFALFDVVLALMLAALTALLAHEGLHALIDGTERAERARADAARAAAVRRQIVTWVRAAVVPGDPAYWNFFGAVRTRSGEAAEAVLAITTDAPGPFTAGRLRLTLAIDRDETTPERGLVAYEGVPEEARVDTLAADTAATALRPLYVLVAGATALSVRYLHAVGGDRVWTTEWASSTDLPDAVEIQVLGDSVPPVLQQPIFVVPRGVR